MPCNATHLSSTSLAPLMSCLLKYAWPFPMCSSSIFSNHVRVAGYLTMASASLRAHGMEIVGSVRSPVNHVVFISCNKIPVTKCPAKSLLDDLTHLDYIALSWSHSATMTVYHAKACVGLCIASQLFKIGRSTAICVNTIYLHIDLLPF